MSAPDFEVVRSLPLSKPIHYAGEELTQLHFRAPEAELLDVLETIRASKKPRGESLAVLSWFTSVGGASLKRLSWADTRSAMEIVGELAGDDLEGGHGEGEAQGSD